MGQVAEGDLVHDLQEEVEVVVHGLQEGEGEVVLRVVLVGEEGVYHALAVEVEVELCGREGEAVVVVPLA